MIRLNHISFFRSFGRYIVTGGIVIFLSPGLFSDQHLYAQEYQTESINQSKAFYLSAGLGFGGVGIGYQFNFAAQYRFGVLSLRYVNFHQIIGDPGDSVGDFALLYGFRDQKNHRWASIHGGLGISQFIERECTEYRDDENWIFRDCLSHTSNIKRVAGLAIEGAVGYRFISLNLVGDFNTSKSFLGLLLNININI